MKSLTHGYITTTEAAELLGIDRHRLVRLERRGIVPPRHHVPGRDRPMFSVADLADFVVAHGYAPEPICRPGRPRRVQNV